MKKFAHICYVFILILLIQCNTYKEIKVYSNINKAEKHKAEVKYINLSSQNLTEFPKEVLDFPNLETLILNFNKIKEVPAEIEKLKKLKELQLMYNPIEVLPTNIIKIKTLQKIYLNETLLEENDILFIKKGLPDCLVVLYSTS